MRDNRRRNNEEESKQNDPWTSNSDLFMAVAVIFLIMFVFSILQSGASQLAVQQEKKEAQEYLLGKVDQESKTKTSKNLEEAKKDLKEMIQKKEILDISLKQIGEITKALEHREESIEELYKQQIENEALIKQSQEIIESQKDQLNTKETQITQKETKIKDISKTIEELQKELKEQLEQKKKLDQQLTQTAQEKTKS